MLEEEGDVVGEMSTVEEEGDVVGEMSTVLANVNILNNSIVQEQIVTTKFLFRKDKTRERKGMALKLNTVTNVNSEKVNRKNKCIILPNVNRRKKRKEKSNIIKVPKGNDNAFTQNFEKEKETMKLILKIPKKFFDRKRERKSLVLKLKIVNREKENKGLKIHPNVNNNKKNNRCANIFKMSALLKTKEHVRRQNNDREKINTVYDFNKNPLLVTHNINEDGEEQLARSMMKVPTFQQLKGHDSNPEVLKAVMLLWENSGRGKFEQLKNILINDNNNNNIDFVEQNIHVIKNEILKEKLNVIEQSEIIAKFLKRLSNKKKLITCASCGERTYNSWYNEVSVEEDLSSLKLNDNQIEEYERLGEFKSIASVTNVNSNLYYVHPECISMEDANPKTNVCIHCYTDIKQNIIPKFSVANGHDYGDFTRVKELEPLTIVEKHLISYNRLYGSILKLKDGQNRQLVGNLITFEHNGPERSAEQFILPHILGISDMIQIAFVGSREEYEVKRKDVILTCGQIQVRAKNVYNWLRVLKKCNPKYWNIKIDESEQCINLMNKITKDLVDNIQIIDSESLIKVEKIVTDDTSKVREIKEDYCDNKLFTKDDINCTTEQMAISNTMLFHDNIEINATKLIEKTLNGVANTIYPKLIKVARLNNEPINEYENNSKLYLGLFPYLFILGKFGSGVDIKGTLPRKYVTHLLNQR